MAPLELGVIRHRPPVPLIGRRSQRQAHLAMNLLLLLALAVPLSCLAFLSLLALLGVMTLGAVIHVLGTIRARRPQWRGVEQLTAPPLQAMAEKLAILVTKLLVAGACFWYVPRPGMPRACLNRAPKSGLTA